jgi:U3 small nucleolar RNA-associated protein 13
VEERPALPLGTLEGHTDSVNAVAWGGDSFVVSGGKDRTVKVWKLRPDRSGAAQVFTCIGHAAEINCLDVSPNEQLIASGGADKRILLWQAGKPLGAAPAMGRKLLGHKRGIWDVRFSPVDRRLASCSGDRTVRIWNVGSGECLRVLEGHLAATLKVRWMSTATQLVSAGSDGLLKIWNAHDGAAAATLDEEQHGGGKIWALDVARDGELVVSGGSDGSLCVWKDATKESTISALKQRQHDAEMKQQLENLVRAGSLAEALTLALQLDHRVHCKNIVELMRRSQSDPREALATVVRSQLSEASIDLLIKLCCEWNKNSQHAMTAQAVMEAVLLALPADRLAKSAAMRSSIEVWIAFSQRHLQRVTHLASSRFVIDHALEMMGGGPLVQAPEPMDLAEDGGTSTHKRTRPQ